MWWGRLKGHDQHEATHVEAKQLTFVVQNYVTESLHLADECIPESLVVSRPVDESMSKTFFIKKMV